MSTMIKTEKFADNVGYKNLLNIKRLARRNSAND